MPSTPPRSVIPIHLQESGDGDPPPPYEAFDPDTQRGNCHGPRLWREYAVCRPSAREPQASPAHIEQQQETGQHNTSQLDLRPESCGDLRRQQYDSYSRLVQPHEADYPNHVFCPACLAFHRRPQDGSQQLGGPNCAANQSVLKFGETVSFSWWHVHLIMRADRLGPRHGIPCPPRTDLQHRGILVSRSGDPNRGPPASSVHS